MLENWAGLTTEQRELVLLLLEEQGVDTRELILPFERPDGRAPLSFAQQRLWFLDRFQPGSPFYNIPSAVRLTGPLDVPALVAALNEVVRRHEALRTRFETVGEGPVQVIAPALTLAAPLIDLAALPAGAREAEARRLATEEARTPFDLSTGPLIRATLLRLAEQDHIVLVTMHHIVSDGWSIGVFVRELAELYAAFAQGRPSPLAPLAVQYADYAAWQREWLQGDVLARQVDYWVQKLGNPPAPVLELPGDRPRPAVQTANGASLGVTFPQALLDRLHDLSRQESATLFMTLLAAFKVLLHRYTGLTDIAVGSPIANRRQAELEGLIGLFINTLVYRTSLAAEPGRPAPTFREVVRRVRQVALEAYDHQDAPFEMLVDALAATGAVERDMSHGSLFQVMFILQNADTRGRRLPGLALETMAVDTGTSTFDLTLNMSEQPGGLATSIEYNTDLFERTTIERLLGHLRTLLEAAAATPDVAISRLPLLTPEERRRTLHDWNANPAGWSPGAFTPPVRLFEQAAAATPTAIAIAAPRLGERDPLRLERWEHITYGELNARANRLARQLRERGVGAETLVAVSAEKSVDLVAGLLAVWKAGGAYIPIDPGYPPERIGHMLRDSGVRLLLVQSSLAERFAAAGPLLIDGAGTGSSVAADNLDLDAGPCDLAYVIYTSGSTGQPKGVMVEQQHILNAYRAWDAAYGLADPVKSHLQAASFSFDVFTGDLLRGLCSGGKLVLAPREVLLQPETLYALMRQEQVTFTDIVPAVLRPLVQYAEETGQSLDFMEILVCGADTWYVSEFWRFLRLCGPRTRLMNSYGVTETTIDTCYYEPHVRQDGAADATSGADLTLQLDQILPIGRPYANQQMYVLDAAGQPVPAGVAGELYIGGAGVARGYLNRPDLTAERFLPDPYGAAGARLYRTGDLARRLPDGSVQFLGRADSQVKIRGYRIEPGEIEAVLDRFEGIAACAVVAATDPAGQKRLVAYYVPRTPAAGGAAEPPSPADLRRYLKERLPEYMAPSLFVAVPELKLTPNDKVDRSALPEPDWTQRAVDEGFVAPRTELEAAVAAAWRDLLGLAEIGIHDNFFELGGHSLLATQLVSRLRSNLGVELPLREVFESPTVAAMAGRIEVLRSAREREGAGSPARPLTIPRAERRPNEAGDVELPLSYAQERLWFLDQLEPGAITYNIPAAVRMTGRLDVDALAGSLAAMAQRHEILRTTFPTTDGVGVQRIAAEARLPLERIDLAALPTAERMAEARRLARQYATTAFDLAHGPLVRACLLALDEDDYLLVVVMHHIISDGWSIEVMIGELGRLYPALAERRGAEAAGQPPLPVQYGDFAVWQRGWLRGEVLAAQLGYWKAELAGIPASLELPLDRPRPAVQTNHGGRIPFDLPAELSRQLADLGRAESATLFMTLLAAFQALLHRYSGQADVCVGTPIANRTHAEIEGLIGFFVNTLVLRGRFARETTFRQLLAGTRDAAHAAYAHQDLPFETLVDALQPRRDLSRSSLFQAMFTLDNPASASAAAGPVLQLPGLRLASEPLSSGAVLFDLSLDMADTPHGLTGVFEYNTDLFDASTIERMIAHFRALLAGLVGQPDRPIAALPVVTPAERETILAAWNRPVSADATPLLPALIAEQARRTPDAPAVVTASGGEGLTYAALHRLAGRIARGLVGLGAGPECITGILLERSPELIAALLGVWQAGAAYLPLDPQHPRERIAYMLEDSGARLVITRGGLRAALPAGVRVLDLDEPFGGPDGEAAPPANLAAEGLAYVIYTSGSTGKPKGVMVSHGSVANYVLSAAEDFGLAGHDRVLQFASISFDAAAEEIYPCLVRGGALVLRSQEMTGSFPEFAAACARHGVTVLDLPTAFWHQLVLALEAGDLALPPAVRLVVIGGERALPVRLARWRELVGAQVRLLNTYGPTEGTIVATQWELSAAGERALPPGETPIGSPVRNVRAYVLDAGLGLSGVGLPGELHLGGAGVARGYLNRPDLTAERFVPDPFAAGRMYRTGDQVRWLADGNLEFLGRVDRQVKIRGFRIELGEIEEALVRHPLVQEAAVLALALGGGGPDAGPGQDEAGRHGERLQLVAYVQPRGESVEAAELRRHLLASLPEYMAPAYFVSVPAMPLTPSGKIDHRALPAPDAATAVGAAGAAGEGREPATPAERILAGIWARLLGVERVSADANFFELGGDSILSIQVIARANQAGLRLTPRQLFEAPTLAALAALAAPAATVPAAAQGPSSGPLTLTPIMRWFFEQDLPARSHWNQSLLLTTPPGMDAAALRSAVDALVAHHDVFRLRFEERDGAWHAGYAAGLGDAHLERTFEVVDLSTAPAEAASTLVEDHARRVQASLDILRGPLLRVVYYDPGATRPGRLQIVIHHLVTDGVSWRILLEDLQAGYEQQRAGGRIELPARTTSFQAWAEALHAYAQGAEIAGEAQYWLDAAKEWTPPIPRDFWSGSEDNTEASAEEITVSLSEDETAALVTAAPAAYGTEITDLLLSALLLAFEEWTGSAVVNVEMEGHGREDIGADVDLSRTVGWFTTVYPVRLELPGTGAGVAGTIRSVKEQLRRVPQRGIGYGLLRYLAPDEEVRAVLAGLPAPEVTFNYLGRFDGGGGSGLAAAPESPGFDRAQDGVRTHLLDVTGALAGGRLSISWTFSRAVHERATIAALADAYIGCLRDIIDRWVSDPSGAGDGGGYTPSDFPLADVDQDQLDRILKKTKAL